MAALKAAIKANKLDETRHLAHTIKDIAAKLRDLKLQSIATQLEAKSQQAGSGRLSALITQVEHCYQEFAACLATHEPSSVTKQEPAQEPLAHQLVKLKERLQLGGVIDPAQVQFLKPKNSDKILNDKLNQLFTEVRKLDSGAALKTLAELEASKSTKRSTRK